MRFYLLASTALSLILPFIILPMELSTKIISTNSFPDTFLMRSQKAATTVVNQNSTIIQANSGISLLEVILFTDFIVYVIGFIYKSYLFGKNLIKMNALIKKSAKVKEEKYWIVSLKSEVPAFSFFNYIFMNNTYKNLSSDELELIKKHELIHVKHFHTFDILFAELVGILFWFNPIVNYLKKSLKEIHEYIVDEKIAGHGENKKAYANLLLNLASDTKVVDLATSFTGEPIKRRILMLAKPRTSPKYKLMFFVLVPLTALLLVSFSGLKNPKSNSTTHNEITSTHLELKKYCGVYVHSKRDTNFGQNPMEILLKDNKLFRLIEAEPKSANRLVELRFEADSLFSYADNSGRSALFFLDSKKEVTGCALVKLVTKEHRNYLILEEGEYSKRQSGNLKKY
jgi:hypothetical protein